MSTADPTAVGAVTPDPPPPPAAPEGVAPDITFSRTPSRTRPENEDVAPRSATAEPPD